MTSVTSEKKVTTLDWTLPASFLPLLVSPVSQIVDTLIPIHHFPAKPDSEVFTPSKPFIDALKKLPDGLTDNGAAAHSTTNSPLVDLFFDFTNDIDATHLYELLEKAWGEDPESTLRIILHTRSIHEGKGYKEGFFRATGWLWDKHPRSMLENLHLLTDPTCVRHPSKQREAKQQEDVEKKLQDEDEVMTLNDKADVDMEGDKKEEYTPRPHGSFDDLVDLLILHINGELSLAYTGRFKSIDEALAPAFQRSSFKLQRLASKVSASSKRDRSKLRALSNMYKKRVGASATRDDGSEVSSVVSTVEDFQAKLWACGSKLEKHNVMHQRLDEALRNDKKFQALYLTITDIFVRQLRADLDRLDHHNDFIKLPDEERNTYTGKDSSPHLFGMSYAAKWVPTPAHGADKQVHLASAIGLGLFPGEGVDLARQKLQGKVLSLLRRTLKVPEVRMGQGTWHIAYTKVPAKAMSRYSILFMQRDPKGFEEYLTKVAKGKTSIAGATMMPHELLIDAMNETKLVESRLANLQWKSLVDSIASSSKAQLSNCLAVADVSGSMGHLHNGMKKKTPDPIAPCVALTLLLGELAQAPWNGCFFTFSSYPSCEFIDPALTLTERARKLNQAHWEMSTAFYKIFDLILAIAKREKLAPENMIQKLFVFSDMQFDQCGGAQYGETEYDVAKRKFDEAGYPIPELVFWNLAAGGGMKQQNTTKPVPADTPGVSLLSGFSGAMMKYFLGASQAGEEEVAIEEEEARVDAEWELHDADEPELSVTAKEIETAKLSKQKKRKDPLETLMAIIGAESFKGVVVID